MSIRLKPLKEQVVVITGASSGIGRTTAIHFARHGAKVVLAARNEEALNAVAEEIRNLDAEAHVVVTDVSNAGQVKKLADAAVERFGRIDTWVNNAGVAAYSYMADQPLEEIERIIQVNLLGVIYGSKAALDSGMRVHGGAIINVGSALSERSIPLLGIYCATKHGVKGFTEALRLELAHENAPVSVTLIKPAVINTPFYRNARTHLGKRPKPGPPPIYPPEVVAETIAKAAETPLRDVFAGSVGVGFKAGEFFAPGLLDKIMGGTEIFFEDTLTEEEDDGRSILFAPASGKGSGSGGYENSVVSDPYTRYIELQPALKKAVVASLLLGVAALLLRRRTA